MNIKQKKIEIAESIIDDITKLYKTSSEINRVISILENAEIQSSKKQIIRVRKPNPIKKFFARWYIRFKYGIHWAKPFYPLRVLRNHLRSFVYNALKSDKCVLRGLEFAITFKCNFNCSHCLCSRIDETNTRKELSPVEYRDIVTQAMKLGATTFGLEGGEPFVEKNWDKYIEAWYPKYNHIIISTNGFLFDEKKAITCQKLGVDTINFSMDSGIPEIHDVFRRKKGSFEKVMQGIRLCKKYKIKVILNTVVHKKNLYTDGLIKLFEFSEKEKIMVNVLFAKGVGEFKDKNVMLTEKDFSEFKKIAEPYNYWHIHHDGALKANYTKTGCPGLKEMVNMTPYGDVIACANCHIYFGNVRKESLKAIRDRALKGSPFGKYRRCFLTQDQDFMNIYYGLLHEKKDGNAYISLNEFRKTLSAYEKKENKIVYSELDNENF